MYKILLTLCEIQDILYTGEMQRTVEHILRLNNQIFLHACLIKEVAGRKPKSMTSRLLRGKYFHAITCHAPIMYKIVSGKAANSEVEDRVFQILKKISSTTSNHHPGHVLINNMIRLQVREEFNPHKVGKEQHEVRKLCQCMSEKNNTTIPYWVIDKYPWEWQEYLKRIADYIYMKSVGGLKMMKG